jgi:hypothetical protein
VAPVRLCFGVYLRACCKAQRLEDIKTVQRAADKLKQLQTHFISRQYLQHESRYYPVKNGVVSAKSVGCSCDEPKVARCSDWMRSQAAESADTHFQPCGCFLHSHLGSFMTPNSRTCLSTSVVCSASCCLQNLFRKLHSRTLNMPGKARGY